VSATKPVFIASDAHLGAAPPEQERAFLAWLGHAAERASWIILNGDLFDFWFEYRSGTTHGHDVALEHLRTVVGAGVPITLMGGNHDWWGGRYLREEIGVEFLQRPVVREIAGKRTLLAHGDGLGRGDHGYRALSHVLRARATRWVFGALPPRLGDRMARHVSRTEEKWDEWGPRQEARSLALSRWAHDRLADDPELDMVVLGHTHCPLLERVGPGRWYVNTGDWVVHRSYVVVEEDRDPTLVAWEEGAS